MESNSHQSNGRIGYPSGVAALFASHAREGKPICFLSVTGWLFGVEILVKKGDLITAKLNKWGSYQVTINGNEDNFLQISAKEVNDLAGKKLVEE